MCSFRKFHTPTKEDNGNFEGGGAQQQRNYNKMYGTKMEIEEDPKTSECTLTLPGLGLSHGDLFISIVQTESKSKFDVKKLFGRVFLR